VAPLPEIARAVRSELLNPTNGLPAQAQAILRTKLNIPEGKIDPIGQNTGKAVTEGQH
jgi:hypothetical protein